MKTYKKTQGLCAGCGVEINISYPHQKNKWCDKCRYTNLKSSYSQSIKKQFRNKPFGKEDFITYPTTEQEVVVLFFKIFKKLGFTKIVKIQQGFPDAIVIDENNKKKTIEFEYCSSSYKTHLPEKCDYIVCWINNSKSVSIGEISIIELSSLPMFK